MTNLQKALETFQTHYAARLGTINLLQQDFSPINEYYYFDNETLLRPGNGPRILYHGQPTKHVIVLTHGLSDSPHYLLAVAKRFYKEGCNVILTLLPAHGLKDPDEAMEDKSLDSKWKACIDNGVETAQFLGEKISVGGFSTGGALSLNKILRDPTQINGGLFLFSGALSVGSAAEKAGRLRFIQSITKLADGKLPGIGQDPFKYPRLPNFAGLELTQIINENNRKLNGFKIDQPAIAAHSIHDTTAFASGITTFIEDHVKRGSAIFIAQDVTHSQLPLEVDIQLDLAQELGPEKPPVANPQFEWMMDGIIRFFQTM